MEGLVGEAAARRGSSKNYFSREAKVVYKLLFIFFGVAQHLPVGHVAHALKIRRGA